MNKKRLLIGYTMVFLSAPLHAEVLQLVAGARESAALISGGDVMQWGEWGGALPTAVFGIDRVKALAAGSRHLLALRVDGTVWAWGNNSAGQLGNGTVINSDRPGAVMDVTGAVAIAAGGNRSYVLKNDGTVWAWGSNAGGLLGDGTSNDRRGPVVMEGLIDVVAIAAGEAIFAALRKDGGVCILGVGTQPSTISCNDNFHNVTALAADGRGVYVLLKDGTVHNLANGLCGEPAPANDLILDDVRTITAGLSQLLLVKQDGTLWSCGSRPSQVGGGLINVQQIAAGANHYLASTESGVWTWGENASGQLGIGTTTPRETPGPVWDGTGRLR